MPISPVNSLCFPFVHFQSLSIGTLGYVALFSPLSKILKSILYKHASEVIKLAFNFTCKLELSAVRRYNGLMQCMYVDSQSLGRDELCNWWIHILSCNFSIHQYEGNLRRGACCKLLMTLKSMRPVKIISISKSCLTFDACTVLLSWCSFILRRNCQSSCLGNRPSWVSYHDLTTGPVAHHQSFYWKHWLFPHLATRWSSPMDSYAGSEYMDSSFESSKKE